MPAVWTTLRKALLHGDSSDRERARSIIAEHNSMMWARQNTFNHWMWCQGFRYTPFGY